MNIQGFVYKSPQKKKVFVNRMLEKEWNFSKIRIFVITKIVYKQT